MKRTAHKKRRNPVTFLLSGMIIIISVFLLSGAFLVMAEESESDSGRRYYKSIQIQSSDTLWNIAEDYMTDEYDSVDEYIRDLKEINTLNSDFIQSGQYLIVVCRD